VLVNRSVDAGKTERSVAALEALRARLSPEARRGLQTVCAEFETRRRIETSLRSRLEGATQCGVVRLREQLALAGAHTPFAVVQNLAAELRAALGPVA
jgi:hypothetical protein